MQRNNNNNLQNNINERHQSVLRLFVGEVYKNSCRWEIAVSEVLVLMDLSLLPESLTGMGGVSYDLSCSPHSPGGGASDGLPS